MPRFFFHTQDGAAVRDEEGVELIDLEHAKIEGAGLLAEMLRSNPEEFWRSQSLSLTVSDGEGLTYFVIDVAAITSPAAPAEA